MSEFIFICPHCSQSLEVDESMAGRETTCPSCQCQITPTLPVFRKDTSPIIPDNNAPPRDTKQKTIPNFVLPNNIFNWLGLGDRLINGTVYAKEAYMPREGGCQDVGYNAWEFVATRDKFLDLAGVDQNLYGTKRSVVVIRRTSSKYVANHGDYKQRTWPKKMYVQMLESLTISFPNHRIDIYSDGDSELMKCRECQIRMFHDADVVLAIHGAGLTNTMFMRPGGVVVEVIPMFDTRHAPLTGIFPRLSGIIGLNHYTYSSLENINNVDAVDLVSETLAFAFAVGVQL